MTASSTCSIAVLLLAVARSVSAAEAVAGAVWECPVDGRPALLDRPILPDCREIAGQDLSLGVGTADLAELGRQLRDQEARIARLERLLLGRPGALPEARRSAPIADPFDTRGRLRDLGQNIDRRLDNLGR